MRKEPLSTLCKISNGFAFKSNDYTSHGHRVMRITNVQKGIVVDSDPKFIPNEIADKAYNFKLNAGDILVSLTGNVGRVGRILSQHLPAVLNQRVGLIRPTSSEINDKYLFQYLNSDEFERKAIQNANGVAQLNLSTKWIENYEISLPPLDDQIRIAHLLEKVEGLVAQRKQHLQQLDDLLKSVFLDMFGDPVRNERGWKKTQFSELLVDIESGKSPKCEARQAEPDEWGVLKLGAVTRCKFDETESKALPKDISPSVRDEVKAGDLLFSRKNTYELVAACAYVFQTRAKLLMPDLIFRFVFKQDAGINPIFIWKLLISDSQRKAIQSLAAGAAGSMPNISKANLKTVLLPIPPLPLQNQFANFVEKVEVIKSRYQQSLTDLESLYGALIQQAFKGELDLSCVPMPDIKVEEEKTMVAEHLHIPDEHSLVEPYLPDPENLLAVLENSEARRDLIVHWLEAYCNQLGSTPFSVQHFMAVVQTRLAELYPDNDIVLGSTDYEYIKAWLFDELASSQLVQVFDDADNCIELRAVQK